MQRLKPADESHAEHRRAPPVRRSLALAAVPVVAVAVAAYPALAAVLLLVAVVPLVSRGRPGD